MSYSLRAAKLYFDLFGPLLFLPNLLDSPVYSRLIRLGGLDHCGSILELGAGVGTLAKKILRRNQQPDLRLVLLEVSTSNLAVLQRRFRDCPRHVALKQVVGDPPYEFAEGTFDRFVSCFVIEVMDEAHRARNIAEAHRLLKPGGLFCCMAVTRGNSWVSRATMFVAEQLSKISRWLVLGAQFCDLADCFAPQDWNILHQETVSSAGFATKILIVEKRAVPVDDSAGEPAA